MDPRDAPIMTDRNGIADALWKTVCKSRKGPDACRLRELRGGATTPDGRRAFNEKLNSFRAARRLELRGVLRGGEVDDEVDDEVDESKSDAYPPTGHSGMCSLM